MTSDGWTDRMDDVQIDAMTDGTDDVQMDGDFTGISCRGFTLIFSPLVLGIFDGYQQMVMEGMTDCLMD